MKVKNLIISLCLMLAFIISGCGTDSASTDTGNTLRYGSGDYARINPALDEHGEINALIFDGLTDHDGDGSIIPRLAQSWDYDAATHTYTFHLAENVKWHDGQPFTAEDVKFTYDIIMNPDNESENAPNYEDVKEIKVIDDHTISFTLADENHAFLEYMTMAILPKHLLEGKDMQTDEFFRQPVGTGPYAFKSWDKGQAITLTKNSDYFAGPADIDTIIFKIVTDDSSKAMQLHSGELDLAQVTPKDAKNFASDEKFDIYDMKTADYRAICYNFANPYWQTNADLIPAINYAIDRQAILDSVLLGQGEIAYGPLQRNIFNNADVEHYDFDIAKAEAMLTAAGCTKDADGYWTRNGQRIGFTINAMPGDQVRIDLAQIIAQELQSIGLDVKADVPAGGIDWEGQEAAIIGWGSPFDADDHTYKVFGTDKGANYSAYANPVVDQYLKAARSTADAEQRRAAYAAFQQELTVHPAYTFICYIDAMYISDKKISGIAKDTVLGHHGVGIFWNITDWKLAK